MSSSYHLTVKKYLDQNRIDCLLPEYIQRGWNRVYTIEEEEFNQRSCIIAPDVHIPNSIVRLRLGTTKMWMKANKETLHKAFELPDELLMNLSTEQKLPDTIEEEELSFDWDDDDDNNEAKRKKSVVDVLINKQRDKRRKYEDYKYDYDNTEPLPLDEIIEEIRSNIGKDLKADDLKLITELMQIISRHKKDQIMNIYDELTDVHLISKFGGVPKLVQALQEIQKAFEQIAMKTNVASIETVIDVLRERDDTYRVAVELLNSFNENTKKYKQQQKVKLNNKSGDISDHDHTVFNILIKDRITRLPASDLTTLIRDLEKVQNIDATKINSERDDQVKYLSEQLNIIFTRAHLDGIKAVLYAMKSSVTSSLREFIDTIENSLQTKLTEHDYILVESYIQDHFTSLNNNELKTVYERLAQQGTLKRFTDSGELNQMISMGLMKKIGTDGLGTVIESIKGAQIDINSVNELIQALTRINHYIQTQSSVSLEQIQTQLGAAYFIETRNLNEENILELSKAADFYSITHNEETSTFFDHLKPPFIRICIQRILNLINQDVPIDLNKVSNRFYNERIIDLLNELIHGSDELNRNFLFHQIKVQLKKTKELPDKLYRQMLKDQLIQLDPKIKTDTDKKKISVISNRINQILFNEDDYINQEQLVNTLDRLDINVPERIKHWYKKKSNLRTLISSSVKTKKGKIDHKNNVKGLPSRGKSVAPAAATSTRRTNDRSIGPPSKTLKQQKDHLPNAAQITSSKQGSEPKGSLLKSRSKTQSIIHEEKEHSKTDQDTQKKTKANSSVLLASKSDEQQKHMLVSVHDEPSALSSPTITDEFSINNVPKLPAENDFSEQSELSIVPSQSTKETIEYTDSLIPKQDGENQQLSDHTVTEKNKQDSETASTSNSILNDIQTTSSIDNEQMTTAQIITELKTKEEFDLLKQSDSAHEKSLTLTRIDMSQVNLENIRPELITEGKMGNNNTLNFDVNHPAAVLFYHTSLPIDPHRDINSSLTSTTAEFVNDSSYEKTKAQRILAKAILRSTSQQNTEGDTLGTSSSLTTLTVSSSGTIPVASETQKPSGPLTQPVDEPLPPPPENIKSSAKIPHRILQKSLKKAEDVYTNSLTKSLRGLLTQSKYDSTKLKKIHEELIASGHISPLNEFYRSTNEALRVTLDHCVTYDDLIKWTLSLLQTNNKPNLLDFGHDLYSIAIELDATLVDRVDNTRCGIEIQENLKHELQTITEADLREINSYLNAAQLEKIVKVSKKLNVTSKDRMTSDLNSLLLHLIQACHTFDSKYRPMQTCIREIAETYKSRAVADLARKIDEIEKRLAKDFTTTFFGVSKRMNESRFILTK